MFRGWPILIALVVAGCSGPQFASVEGIVTLDNRPLADVEVQFIPEPKSGTEGPSASAYTDAAGRYRFAATTTTGVLVGHYRVCLNDATIMMPGGGVDPASGEPSAKAGAVRPRIARVPTMYSDATQTPFRQIIVNQGSNTHDFRLTRQP